MLDILFALLKSASATLLSLVFGLVVIKTLAWNIGPKGVGLFSILRQLQNVGSMICTLGGTTAITQGLASLSQQEKPAFLRTVSRNIILASAVIIVITIIGAQPIASWLFNNEILHPRQLIMLSTIPIALGTVLCYSQGVLGGFKQNGKVGIVQTISTLTMALLVYPICLLMRAGSENAIVILLSCGLLVGGVAGILLAKAMVKLPTLQDLTRYGNNNKKYNQHYFQLSAATLASGLYNMMVILLIKAVLVHQFDLPSTGLFESAWMLSVMYVMLLLTSFSSYYLPNLAQITENTLRVNYINKTLAVAMMFAIPAITIMLSIRSPLLQLLYSDKFIPAADSLRWLLIGDYFKIMSHIFAITMLAYRDAKRFFWSELIAGSTLLFLVYFCVTQTKSAESAAIAVMLNYIGYYIFTYFYVLKKLRFRFPRFIFVAGISGTIVILSAALSNWDRNTPHYMLSIICITVSVLLSATIYFKSKRIYQS